MHDNDLLQRRYRILGKNAPLFYEEPLHLVRGEGVWMYDATGQRYLDVYNNVPTVGHCHPKVVNAIAEQARTLNIHTRYLHETIVTYGENLTSRFDPALSMLFLTCTGSEANDLALRIARSHTGKQGIVCTNATYHGNTTAVDALATLFNNGESGHPHVEAVDFPCTYRPFMGLSGNALVDAHVHQLQNTIDRFDRDDIGFAGMLICPIFANEGLSDVPPGYFEAISDCVRTAGGLLIFDEVQSGFGRTGNMWGYQGTGVVPDVVTLGKPMGNGHPLAGVVCTAQLCDQFRQHTMYFNTFGGNPVSCAAGQAVLDVIDSENLLAHCRDVSAYLRKGLETLSQQYSLIGNIRNSGLFFGVDLVSDRQTKKPATEEASFIVNTLKSEGVLISKIGQQGNILKMRPPLCFSAENADLLLDTLSKALKQAESINSR